MSNRETALNDTVRLTFSTMRPQRTEVDIAAAISTALHLPGVQAHWRIAVAPEIVQHEKIKDIRIIERIYALDKTKKGNYRVVVKTEGREFTESITI